jgi:cathepsin D
VLLLIDINSRYHLIAFSILEIIIQGKSVHITSGASALADFSLSGSLISGPVSDVAAMWAAFPAAVPSTTHPGYYQFRAPPLLLFWLTSINNGPTACNATVSVSISFGGRLWPINPVDMNIGHVAAGSSQCLGAIISGSNTINTDGTANWIFGTAFMVSDFVLFFHSSLSVLLSLSLLSIFFFVISSR